MLLQKYVLEECRDDNNFFVGVERALKNQPTWVYFEEPNPGNFTDQDVPMWSNQKKRDKQKKNTCFCYLAGGNMILWPGLGYHDFNSLWGSALCEMPSENPGVTGIETVTPINTATRTVCPEGAMKC